MSKRALVLVVVSPVVPHGLKVLIFAAVAVVLVFVLVVLGGLNNSFVLTVAPIVSCGSESACSCGSSSGSSSWHRQSLFL